MKLTTYPPLAATTVIDGDEVEVIVCMDLTPSEFQSLGGSGDVICRVWHDNGGHGHWREEEMVAVDAADVDVFSVTSNPTLYFKAELKAPNPRSPTYFTVNYTYPDPSSSDPNRRSQNWANSDLETSDGVIIFRSNDTLQQANIDLNTYFTPPLHQTVSYRSLTKDPTIASGPRDPKTWVYTFGIPRGGLSPSPGYAEAILASPINDAIISYFATIKHGTAWIQPHHSEHRGIGRYEGFHPPRESVLAAFQTYTGDVVVFLPISSSSRTVYIKGDDKGHVVAVGRNDGRKEVDGQVVVVVARDAEEAVEEAMYWVKRIVGGMEAETTSVVEDPWTDSLKYCTWNSLGRDLTHKRIVDAVNDLYDSGIYPETVIIDDNWQSLNNDNRDWGFKMTEFEADRRYFPRGLKGLVADIKRNRGVKHVAVWHGILGYWNGISPTGWIAENYKLRSVGNGSIYVVDKEDIGRFYDDFYRFLSQQGITAVKADTQCLLDEKLPSPDKGELFPAYLAAWRTAASKYFGTRAISCMSMLPQVIFTNHLLPTLPRFTFRNSDDFFPHSPDSHPWHIFCNAHNSIFTSRLNVTADWDMFQTKHEFGSYHAAARAISGGPVYITDDVGRHDLSVVRKITARGRNGEKAVVLRPTAGAKSMQYFRGFGESKNVKIVSEAGGNGYKMKLIGTFDLDGGRERTDMVAIKDLVGPSAFSSDGVDAGERREREYAVYSHSSGTAKLVGEKSYIKTTIQKGGWDVSTVCPIVPVNVDGGRGEVGVAVFGLLEQISGAAGVVDVKIAGNGSTVKVGVELKALGVLGIFANYTDPSRYGKIRQVTLGGEDVPERFVTVGKGSEYGTIKVDVEHAWDDLGLDDRWELWVWVHLAA
ncbi:Alpha-galactosidase [Arthrobotrys entomopaga]|nr:Alpha-galactosidase [Arthrobotrys entomopaga]